MLGLLEFIKTHFYHVAPIILAGIFALAIIVERLRALYLVYPIRDEDGFFERVQELVMAGKFAEAVALCDKHSKKPAAVVVKKALLRAHQPESLIENGLDIAIEDAIEKIQRRTHFLSMIANVATLLGLLGTIAGLVQSFEAVGTADATMKAKLLAEGISQAMHATMMGLGVAVPAMVAFSFLINRTNRLTSSVETAGSRVLDILKQRYFAAETQAVGQSQSAGGRGVA